VDRIAKSGIIAVLVIDDVRDAIPLAQTLLDNGIGAMELTLCTDAAVQLFYAGQKVGEVRSDNYGEFRLGRLEQVE
jgi:2-dehydro-3-deoxyphosphogluconate aldolase/(4S)-4-hydroxy-2-oxoglutarate aldolase